MGNKAGLNWDLTANQSFWLYRSIYHIENKIFVERLNEMAELMEVTQLLDTQVRRLSLGERMKLELIGSILHKPEVLFLDEPTIGLDIIAKKNIRTFLKEIQKKEGITLVLTSHDMDDVEQVCERVIVVNKGSKVYDDSLQSLTSKYEQSRYVRFVFKQTPNSTELETLGKIVEQSDEYYVYRVEPKSLVKLIANVSAKYDIIDLHIAPTPLEEIIAEIFRTQV